MSATLELAGWEPLPDRPQLRAGIVDVCAADLDLVDDGVAASLSAVERKRATQLVDGRGGRRWTRTRGLLRALLGRYLDLEPDAVELALSERGKPALAVGGAERLRFSLSRSAGIALYAFAREREVGVDVEARERPLRELAIARRAFERGDVERLATLAQPALRREFLRLWVRHEAVVKCLGTGLAHPPSAAERADLWTAGLDLGPGIAAAVTSDGGPPDELRRWSIQSAAII